MAYRIFLSHNTADVQWVIWLASHARSIGIDVYFYEEQPEPGIPIPIKIKAQIAACDALVVLLTINSQYSPFVQQEIGIAEGQGKLVIPLVQPGVDQGALAILQGREYVPFDFANPQTALGVLQRSLWMLHEQKDQAHALSTTALLGLGVLLILGISERKPKRRRH